MLEPFSRKSVLALVIAIAIAPVHVHAAAAPATDGLPEEPAPAQPEPSDEPPSDVEAPPDEPAPIDEPAPVDEPPPRSTTPPKPLPPTTKATPKPEVDAADDEALQPIPQRLPPMQTAGWWTLFGGFAIGTVAGVLAGLAEREEDRAVRLSVKYDLDSGAQPQYQDIKSEYEHSLRKGRAEANAAIGLAVVGLGAAIAGLTVLLVAQTRGRRAKRNTPVNARVRLRGGGLQVRF